MQAMSRRAPIGDLWNSIQSWLFPLLEDELGELDEKHRQFVSVCERQPTTLDSRGVDQNPLWREDRRSYQPRRHRHPRPRKSHGEAAGEDRIVNLYDLADAAYDAKEIREMSARLGHVAIIDDNPGRGEKREFSPAEAVRYRERSAVERVNSHLHEQHGGRHVHVRGPVKVAAHLAFGLVVIAAEQMLRMLG